MYFMSVLCDVYFSYKDTKVMKYVLVSFEAAFLLWNIGLYVVLNFIRLSTVAGWEFDGIVGFASVSLIFGLLATWYDVCSS